MGTELNILFLNLLTLFSQNLIQYIGLENKERLDFLGKKYGKEQLDELQKILDEWEIKRDEAAKKELLHEVIENIITMKMSKNFLQSLNFLRSLLKNIHQ